MRIRFRRCGILPRYANGKEKGKRNGPGADAPPVGERAGSRELKDATSARGGWSGIPTATDGEGSNEAK